MVEVAERRRRVLGGRHNVVKVKLTDDELTLVKSSAAEAGLTVPHLLAEAVLGWIAARGQLPAGERRAVLIELQAIRRLLAVYTDGLDQLAAAGTTRGSPRDLDAAVQAVLALAERLDMILDDLTCPAIEGDE
ncbi:hypothetical protein [Nonomuraea sp. NEAU-A123]|uniref:hypothetical protein n=1 Tax=Nonomuraea sp. NEAU-A123 TaxID=2839649 RepID=UPI001BE40736|nr:hypothetical protein [Nonomuraea sp. NEAU-A123]MBT2235779.1 hypothetical protein [Nonomuraea sp. NEAU-A123]